MPAVMAKLREEMDEIVEAQHSGAADRIADEVGDLLFVAVNVAALPGMAVIPFLPWRSVPSFSEPTPLVRNDSPSLEIHLANP